MAPGRWTRNTIPLSLLPGEEQPQKIQYLRILKVASRFRYISLVIG
jgi:hypothetical protein